MRLFGYPYNDLVICKDSPDYLLFSLISIYNALILPQINYCLLCWGYDTSEIFLLQKKAIRIISGANIKSHTEPILKLYNLLKIEDIYKS